MACRPTEKSYGYEDDRFEKHVDENLHCSICYKVLKEPRMCRNNEHMFCFECITEHLTVNSESCPECKEHLSIDTLRRPHVANNHLSKMKLSCDYASRGCREFTCVEDLEKHVENCGFAPVLCSNEECKTEINKQDKGRHENEICKHRKLEGHNCEQMHEVVQNLEKSLVKLDWKVETTNEKIKNLNVLNGKVETLNKETEIRLDEIEQDLNKVEVIKEEIKDLKENISKVSKDVDEVKVTMAQMLEKLNMLEQLNELSSAPEGMLNTPREDILIAGGCAPYGGKGKSAMIYSWEKNGWFEVSSMNEEHESSSSFIYNGQLYVAGGSSKTIETLDLNELPLKWTKFPGELPYECFSHQTVVYQQRVIHIGGYNRETGKWSDAISELQLTPPYAVKELCRMPEPRCHHAAEIFEDKVLILGGVSYDVGTMDSVLEFDVKKNECKEKPPLPRALSSMATVRWRDQVIILGGHDKEKPLNDVFMYDSKTGETTVLPPMLERRDGCCAAITGNTIVAMGGFNWDHKYVNSVECFTMGGYTWKYLCDMPDRMHAVAEVLPSTKQYV